MSYTKTTWIDAELGQIDPHEEDRLIDEDELPVEVNHPRNWRRRGDGRRHHHRLTTWSMSRPSSSASWR